MTRRMFIGRSFGKWDHGRLGQIVELTKLAAFLIPYLGSLSSLLYVGCVSEVDFAFSKPGAGRFCPKSVLRHLVRLYYGITDVE
jgi:hypothetical protein